MKICEEMTKLRKYLDDNGISWVDNSASQDCGIYRTQFYINGILFSVLYGCGTYGGYNIRKDEDFGLLELWSDIVPAFDHVDGWLTAENIIDFIKRAEKKVK